MAAVKGPRWLASVSLSDGQQVGRINTTWPHLRSTTWKWGKRPLNFSWFLYRIYSNTRKRLLARHPTCSSYLSPSLSDFAFPELVPGELRGWLPSKERRRGEGVKLEGKKKKKQQSSTTGQKYWKGRRRVQEKLYFPTHYCSWYRRKRRRMLVFLIQWEVSRRNHIRYWKGSEGKRSISQIPLQSCFQDTICVGSEGISEGHVHIALFERSFNTSSMP